MNYVLLDGHMDPMQFESRVAAAWPPEAWHDVTVLVAVSGGADSVGLLRALAALKTGGAGRLVVAHFNHRLRAEAGHDAAFVAELAARLQLPFELGDGAVAATAELQGDGLEAAARSERYAFLQAAAERSGARFVATAHTADDQVETVLHRILRGTGIAGLDGMRRARPLGEAATLIRPLLQIRRAEIRAYLAAIGQPFRDDATNADLSFTRNRIRHDLLPRLASEYNADVAGALLRLADVAREAQQLIDADATKLLEQAVIPSQPITIDCRRLAHEPRHLIREMFVAIWRQERWPLQSMGFTEWDSLASIALDHSPASRSLNLPGNIRAQKTGEQLTLARLL